MLDAARLRSSFARVAASGDEVPLFFYSYLFLRHPEVRSMFPPSMATQRDRLVGALGRIVSEVDRLDSLVPYLAQLGRDHRKFQVVTEHYPAVGEALLATLAHFLGDAWTDELAAEWAAAYDVASRVMIEAAEQAAATTPASWPAEVVAHEVRLPDLAVFTVVPDRRLDYRPGQSLSLEAPSRPRLWRYYSPANAPRHDGSIEFHVRAVDGGWVSSALVHGTGVGDVLTLGSPVGELSLDPASPRDVLMLAGGTGLAPLRAMVEELARDIGNRRRVHLFTQARHAWELYDQPVLSRLAQAHPWLEVVPVVETGSAGPATSGTAAEAALRSARWDRHDVYICGSAAMVTDSREHLVAAGVPGSRIRIESFGYGSTGLPTDPEAADHDPAPEPVAAATRQQQTVLVPGGELGDR